MISHCTTQETTNRVLHCSFDRKKKITTLTLKESSGKNLRLVKEKVIKKLFFHPINIGESWLTITVEQNSTEENTCLEEWSWSAMEVINKVNIEEPAFTLVNLHSTASGTQLLLHYFSPSTNDCYLKIVDYPSLVQRSVLSIQSRASSTALSDDGKQLLIAQDKCLQLFKKNNDSTFNLSPEFRADQFNSNSIVSAIALTHHGFLLWTLDTGTLQNKVSLYKSDTGEILFQVEIDQFMETEKLRASPGFNEAVLHDLLLNTHLSFCVDGSIAYVGSIGKTALVDLQTGRILSYHAVPAFRIIVQIRKTQSGMVVMDERGALTTVPSDQ